MDKDKVRTYADHMGQFYAQRFGFPPVTGRVVGYLSVCEPIEQTVNDIADILLTSRSAVNNALKMLEAQHLLERSRPAGSRSDLVKLKLDVQGHGFDPSEYIEMAAMAREGLELLKDAPPERREALEAAASLGDFLAKRLPELYEEWDAYHKQLKKENK